MFGVDFAFALCVYCSLPGILGFFYSESTIHIGFSSWEVKYLSCKQCLCTIFWLMFLPCNNISQNMLQNLLSEEFLIKCIFEKHSCYSCREARKYFECQHVKAGLTVVYWGIYLQFMYPGWNYEVVSMKTAASLNAWCICEINTDNIQYGKEGTLRFTLTGWYLF